MDVAGAGELRARRRGAGTTIRRRRLGVHSRIVLLLAVAGAAFLGGILLWHKSTLRRADELFEDQKLERAGQIRKVVQLRSQSLETLAKDYTYWDEMVSFTKTGDVQWAKENIDTCLATYDADAAWVFDADKRLLYGVDAASLAEGDAVAEATDADASQADDAAASEPPHEEPASRPAVAHAWPPPPVDLFAAAKDLATAPFAHCFVRDGAVWTEIRGARLHAGDDPDRKGESFGWFFVSRRWDPAFLLELSYLIDATAVLPPDPASPAPKDERRLGVMAHVLPLPGSGLGPGPRLDVVADRPSLALLYGESGRALQLMAATTAALLLLLFAMLMRGVSRPLSILSRTLRTGNLRLLADLIHESTEFGDAARLVRDSFEHRASLVSEIAERKRAESALATARDAAQASTRAKSAFLANMSHEIRTPMNGVIGMAACLADTPLSPDQREAVDVIRGSADLLLALLNDLLDFSKIESGKLRLESIPVDVARLTEETADLLGPKAEAKGVEMRVVVERDVPRDLLGDATRIRQVLINLVSNAVKFTERGEISVEARLVEATAASALVEFSVADTGIGIPADRIGAIFESFTQADDATTRRFGGTGLGLTICRQLAEHMGGGVTVASEPGKGSVFRARVRLDRSGVAAESADCALRGLRALVVGSKIERRRAATEALAAFGAEVETASDRRTAAAAVLRAGANGAPFGVVVVDADDLPPAGALAEFRRRDLADLPLVVVAPRGATPPDLGSRATTVNRPIRRVALRRATATARGEAPATETPTPAAIPAGDPGFPGLRVLLVEDNAVNRKVALRVLGKWGVHPEIAENGKEAVAAWERGGCDVVLMDCQMPEMDGYEATRRIRAAETERGLPRTPIIAMTAGVLPEDRARCVEAGMDSHVAKPLLPAELVEALRRHAPARV